MHDVIMPALGMAQDTGKLVQWLKQPGDAVAVGEQLFEVETDKTVMEVEAQADGFLTQVSASDGEDVPVGQVIAHISASADNPVAAPVANTDVTPAPDLTSARIPVESMGSAPSSAPAAIDGQSDHGRVLASPKARRLAREEGLDLGDLVVAGQPQPYHATDLVALRSLSVTRPPGQAVVVAAAKQITARTPRRGSLEFIDWMQADGEITVTTTAMFTSFAAGAWRAATASGSIIVQVTPPDGPVRTMLDPDFVRLSASQQEVDNDPTFVLHDLSDGFLTSVRLGETILPNLSIGADGDCYLITFEFGSDHISDDQAIAFVSGLARRLCEPLHHLV